MNSSLVNSEFYSIFTFNKSKQFYQNQVHRGSKGPLKRDNVSVRGGYLSLQCAIYDRYRFMGKQQSQTGVPIICFQNKNIWIINIFNRSKQALGSDALFHYMYIITVKATLYSTEQKTSSTLGWETFSIVNYISTLSSNMQPTNN